MFVWGTSTNIHYIIAGFEGVQVFSDQSRPSGPTQLDISFKFSKVPTKHEALCLVYKLSMEMTLSKMIFKS